MNELNQADPEHVQPALNLAEIRNQIVAEVTAGRLAKEDVHTFTDLLNRQVETGSISPVAARAGELAERALMLDKNDLLLTPRDQEDITHGVVDAKK
jgi:hypothetical protein